MALEQAYLQDLFFATLVFSIVSFFPGYFISLFLFPTKEELGFFERVVLSFALSFSIVPFGLFVQNQFAGLKITNFLIGLNILLVSFAGLLLFFARQKKIMMPRVFYKNFPSGKENEVNWLKPWEK